jgi:transposase
MPLRFYWNHVCLDARVSGAVEIIAWAIRQGTEPVIPSMSNRKFKRLHDKALYKLRHWVENAFLHIKQWRGIATRYAKNAKSYLAAVHIRCLILWLKIS